MDLLSNFQFHFFFSYQVNDHKDKSSHGFLSTQVKANNTSLLITGYTPPLTAIYAWIPGHKFGRIFILEFEAVLQFEQWLLLILNNMGRNPGEVNTVVYPEAVAEYDGKKIIKWKQSWMLGCLIFLKKIYEK